MKKDDTMFSIESSELSSFISLCNLKSDIEIKELLLSILPTQISARAVSSNGICCVNGQLTGTFSDIGQIGIDDLSLLKNFSNSINETLKIHKKENKLVLEANKMKFASVLRSPQYITNKVEDEKFNDLLKQAKGNEFQLKSVDIKKITTAVSTINPSFLSFVGKENSLIVKLENQNNELELTFDLEANVQPFEIKTAKVFADLLSVIGMFDITFSMKSGCPVYINIQSKNMNFEYLFAPLNK
jgi:hypothetical protein